MSGPKLPDELTDSSSAETRALGTDGKAAAIGKGQDSAVAKSGLYLAEGELIADKYRLVRRLGEGGMASVWVANNEALDVHVAIKFIRADLEHAGLTLRLLQEARAAAKLGHPGIVRVFDFGKTSKGDPYIVMELLAGEDLGATLKTRGTFNPLRAVRTLLPIADALAVAHAKKIVHRDLKPENIFLAHTEDGKTQPKLVDFGIAKLENPDAQRITQLGAAMGSPAYMSPEQARGLDVDARADIWALSVVLYETLTGRLPFTGTTYTALVCSILESKATPITELGIGDPELWSIIARGLEKDQASRWQNMRELGSALARWAIGKGANDDITGAALRSTWIERPADSEPMGFAQTAATSVLPPEQLSSASGSGPAATQLSATVGGRAPVRPKSVAVIFGFGAALVISIGLGVIWKVAGKGRSAIASEQATPAMIPSPVSSSQPLVEPVVTTASAENAIPPPSASVPVEAKPTETESKPSSSKPIAKTAPATKPATAKTTTKPAEARPLPAPAPKPTQKPPEVDIKTDL